MENESRANMVRSAASLISEHGVNATSFSDVLADSGAPRGSIYHHFPEGKKQLTEEAMALTSERVLTYLRSGVGTTPLEVLDHFVSLWRAVVVSTKATRGCAIAGVAVDGPDEGVDLMRKARDIFRSWASLLAEQLRAVGLASDDAHDVARTSLATMEGALILCRVEGNVEPLDVAAKQLRSLVTARRPPS
ncbi:MAG: TetR-family transcriptional regulator [Acidimicrobiaceae bacterium]|nr:TetR-family transcriptional regulator [Acidimicrobiaceae bacterium]